MTSLPSYCWNTKSSESTPNFIIWTPAVPSMSNVNCNVPASLNSTFPPAASITTSAVASKVISAPESISAITGVVIVLFVKVCVATRDTKVESAPSGNVKTFVTPAEWACDFTIWPWELDSQLNWIAPGLVSPKTVTCPVPFAEILRSILESPPVADSKGGSPVAAFVISNWFTAEPVVWNIIFYHH